MKKIIWSEQSLDDLVAISDYIGRDSAHYASLVIEKLLLSVDRLREFPESGRIVPELGEKSIREVIKLNYRIIFKIDEYAIRILTVINSRQDFESNF